MRNEDQSLYQEPPDHGIDKIEFLGYIAPSTTAIKLDGRKEGGMVTFNFSDSELPEAVRLILLRERLLKITVELVE